MPDDELFPSGGGDPTPPPPKPNGDPPPSPGVVTQEQLAEVLAPLTEQLGGVTQTQGQLAETMRAVQDVIGRLGLAGGGESQEGADDSLDPATFLADPAAAVQKIAEQVMSTGLKEQVAPILSMGVEAIHTQAMSGLQNEIDTTYGEGTWAAEFLPELNPLIERTKRDAPSQLGDTAALRRTVDAVKGMKIERLVELRKTHDEKRAAEVEEARLENLQFVKSNLPAGLVRTDGSSSLNEEGKAFLEKVFRATGEKVDEKSYLASLNSGPTLEDWRATREKK